MKIFISYKSEYRDFARKVRTQVRDWGYGTWFDMDDIPKGTYFRHAIQQGLDSSDVMLGVMTQEAFQSREVMAEWDYFLAHEKDLVPLKYRECKPLYHLVTIQWIDFIQNESQGFAQLKNALEQLATDQKKAPEAPAEEFDEKPLDDFFSSLMEQSDSEPTEAPKHESTTQYPVIPGSSLKGSLRVIALDQINRAHMLNKVEEFWVKGVLENSLTESGTFNLGLTTVSGVVLKHIDYGDYSIPRTAKIVDVFEDMQRQLLILGAPGAGKTTLMLQLTQALIAQARNPDLRPQRPIPAVFNLSSWAAERKPLADWLKDELNWRYAVPHKLASDWIEAEAILPLLDGLDEVGGNYRNDCVDAINTFRLQYTRVDLVVCSRVNDYNLLTRKLDLRGAVILQSLNDEQIQRYIDRPELSGLREILATDPTLREIIRTPFMLNLIIYSYIDIPANKLMFPETTNSREYLFESYTKKLIASHARENTSTDDIYTSQQINKYLSWLAKKLETFQQTIFYIENLQPTWFTQTWQTIGFRFMGSLNGALIGGVLGALATGIPSQMMGGHILGIEVNTHIGLLGGSLTGLLLGFLFKPVNQSIKLYETLKWSVTTRELIFGAISGTILGIMGGIINNLSSGILMGILVGFTFMIADGFKQRESIDTRTYPNQGIRRSIYNTLVITFILVILFGFMMAVLVGLITGEKNSIFAGCIIGLSVGLAVGISSGGVAVVQHFVIRLIFYFSGAMPWNYARFLDTCARISLLRKVGGGYIFAHRYLLEYFAGLEQP